MAPRGATLGVDLDSTIWQFPAWMAATIIHPYNKAIVESREDIHGFERWQEFENLLVRAAGEVLTVREVR